MTTYRRCSRRLLSVAASSCRNRRVAKHLLRGTDSAARPTVVDGTSAISTERSRPTPNADAQALGDPKRLRALIRPQRGLYRTTSSVKGSAGFAAVRSATRLDQKEKREMKSLLEE